MNDWIIVLLFFFGIIWLGAGLIYAIIEDGPRDSDDEPYTRFEYLMQFHPIIWIVRWFSKPMRR